MKSPFEDSRDFPNPHDRPYNHNNDTASTLETESTYSVMKLPQLDLGSPMMEDQTFSPPTSSKTKRFPSLRFALPKREGSVSSANQPNSPFADTHAEQFEPPLPMAASFEHRDSEMKRMRWGTTRHPTGRPKKEAVGRSMTLKKTLRQHLKRFKGRQTSNRRRESMKSIPESGMNLDIIDGYTSEDDKHNDTNETHDDNSKDRKWNRRSIYFNRELPASMIDEETGKTIAWYPRNKTRSAKYTPLTFVPKMLYKSFATDVANSYFLFLIILGAFPIFGVPNPGLAAVPLIVILCISAIKEMIEDSRRTASDYEVNNQPTHILGQIRDDSFSGYVYENRNVNDEKVSLWRRFKKLNTRLSLRIIRYFKYNMTKSGRARRAREEAQDNVENPRNSFDSAFDMPPRISGETTRTTNFRKSLQGRRSGHYKDKTMAFNRSTWKEVKVGDIVRVQNNEEVPADLLILSSSDEDSCCFVETKNLDGETNLKVKQAMKFSLQQQNLRKADDFMNSDFEVQSEGPHLNLYSYEGAVHYHDENDKECSEMATINNMLLRGCTLRNTKWVVGITLFTGPETKIILNTGVTPYKKSRMSRELNYYVLVNFVVLFLICFVSGLVNGIYYRSNNLSRQYFEYGTIAGSPVKNGVVGFFVAVILYQSLVPISLYITVEIIKSLQAYFIYSDVGLYYDRLDLPCVPKSWSISDDLGQIEYVFSDKTGTLTQNLMEFRKCTVNGVSYGKAYTEAMAGLRKRQGVDVEEESRVQNRLIAEDREEMISRLRKISSNVYDEDLSFVSKEIVDDMTGKGGQTQKAATEEFLLALALCHSVLVEEDPHNPEKMVLKAQSPDEAALVGTARGLGFCFVEKSKKGYVLEIQGQEREYQVLNLLEFNSTRKRMSAIVKIPSDNPDEESKCVLYLKGADSIIYLRLSKQKNSKELVEKTLQHLLEYATEGLRTLCIAKRELTWSQYNEWNARHHEASVSLENREEKMEGVADLIERELVLLGGTAIEDRLQDGVPDAISMLGDAGVKLWVLTGDKVETAINIGFSCNLLKNEMELLVLKTDLTTEEKQQHGIMLGDSDEVVIDRLITSYLKHFDLEGTPAELEAAKKDHSMPSDRFGVVIDGDALKMALTNEDNMRKFLLLCKQCCAVLCCRVSPAQKAAVVKMVKDTLSVMTLAIGDGSNDVAMIQQADVGVGIAGEEGRQAAMLSDYALGQFRFLTRLLFTHGRWAYRRFAEMIPSFFYKNINYTFALFWFSIFNDFDGLYLFDFTYLTFVNLAFTSLPVIVLAVFDQDVGPAVSMLVPQLYRVGILRTEFTQTKFWVYMVDGFYQLVVSFFFPWLLYYSTFMSQSGMQADHRFYLGVAVTCISCIGSNTYIWMHQNRWDYVSFICNILGGIIVFGWTGIYTSFISSQEFYKAAAVMFGQASFWACITVGLLVCLLPRFIYDCLQKMYFPTDSDIVRECVDKGEYSMYPENYDPTDPEKPQIDIERSDLEKTLGKLGIDGYRQKSQSRFYDDSAEFIEQYNMADVSTTDMTLKEDRHNRMNVRTSLEMQELTTVSSLSRTRSGQ